jgi:shikimate kinase
MWRVLLTGMSGTGKSTLIERLAALGHQTVDLDGDWVEQQPDGRQLWREDAVAELLSREGEGLLFVAGCEENMGQFVPRFDVAILLTAPLEVLLDRLAVRAGNPYGKSPGDRERVRDDVREVEPLLRRIAHHEVSTTAPVEEVLATVLQLTAGDPV